jgi:putative hydrolase of the HAD superfamily
MIKALIFDLDNCLAPANEVGEEFYQPAFEAMRNANLGVLSEAVLGEAFAACWRHPLDWVADQYGFSSAILSAGWQAFAALEISEPMVGYGDLAVLAELPASRFLVTSGFRRLQQSKIRALGLAQWFSVLLVDAIDEPDRKGKQGLFTLLLDVHHLKPDEVLVVGDNIDSEIEAGNRLGIATVQILRLGVPRGEGASFYIRSLHELRKLIVGSVV